MLNNLTVDIHPLYRLNLKDRFSKHDMPNEDLKVETVDRPQLNRDTIILHTSLLPLYQDNLKKGRYLLTIDTNHRPINKNTLNFQEGTKKLMMKSESTDLCFTQSMTLFPYIHTTTSTSDNDNIHEKNRELQLNCSFLMQPIANEVAKLRDKVRENVKPYKPKIMARQLNESEYNKLVGFLKECEQLNLTDGDDVITFCKKQGWTSIRIDNDDDSEKIELQLSNKEGFLTYFKDNEVYLYRSLFFTFQTSNKIRFAYIDGQHRSLGFFLQYLQYAPSTNGSMMSPTEELEDAEFQHMNRKNLSIDNTITINLIKPKEYCTDIDLSAMFKKESNFIHRQNSNTMGNMEIDQLLNLMSTVYNYKEVQEFDCENFLDYKLKGNPSSRPSDTLTKQEKMEELKTYRQFLVKACALYLVDNNDILKSKRDELINAAHHVVYPKSIQSRGNKHAESLLKPTIPYVLEDVCGGTNRLRSYGLDRNSYAVYMFTMYALFSSTIYNSIEQYVTKLSNKSYELPQQKDGDYTFTYRHQSNVTKTSTSSFEMNDLGM